MRTFYVNTLRVRESVIATVPSWMGLNEIEEKNGNFSMVNCLSVTTSGDLMQSFAQDSYPVSYGILPVLSTIHLVLIFNFVAVLQLSNTVHQWRTP